MAHDCDTDSAERADLPAAIAAVTVGLAGTLLIVIAALSGILLLADGANAAAMTPPPVAGGGWEIGSLSALFVAMLALTAFFWRALAGRLDSALRPARATRRRRR